MSTATRRGPGLAAAASASPAPGAPAHEIYWRTTEPVEPSPPLAGPARADVCIVGGGYTGLWTAHFLKKADPSLEVCILEADYAGAGASGHNDGFVTPTIGHGLANVVRRFGHERAKLAYAAIGRSLLELGRFCRKEGVDADFHPCPIQFVATRPEQLPRLRRDVELAGELGAEVPLLDGPQAKAEIGSPAIQAAALQTGALVNPHKLARSLVRVVRDQGVEIHERTPALGYERSGGGLRVRTPFGHVDATRLLLATNAYQHRFRAFRTHVVPVWSYAMVSEPVPEEWVQELPWPARSGFVEVCNFILFARLTAERRLLIGGGPAPYFFGRDMDLRHMRREGAWDALRAAFARYFPTWGPLRFTHAYGGCVAITRDLVPHVGTLGGGVYYGYGYCGNGITNTHTAGKALRDLILERESDYTRLLFVRAKEARFPPEPLAWAGSQLLTGAMRFQDRHPQLLRRDLI
ncbi:MAG TPA: FAD-binding oxidoreductase [Solirubrobacteraceae bacterium]|nr:FAD-binding oxidoreductase [Solirubrobacteraceae bacterium]